MTTYSYHNLVTPSSYLLPSDNFGLQAQQLSQYHPSHMVNSSVSQVSHQGLSQIPGQISHQGQSQYPSIAQRSVSYPSNSSSHALNNYSYSFQNSLSQGPAITASKSAYMQPQQPQSQRLSSLTQAARQSSYPLTDIHSNSNSQYGSNYQLPYPMKNVQQTSNYNPVGSYNVNGTTFYVPNASVEHDDYTSRSQQQNYNNNDSAVTGGVSAKLDYNLEEMSEFITTKALDIMGRCPGMVKPEFAAQSFVESFTKFTFQVLTATRLPRSTLILSLVYLSDRWSKGSIPKTSAGIHDVYKVLVVALLLANKFHDDNTFTNKSWHEATGVPIADLGVIESDWLRAIQWTLHLEKGQGWDEWNQVYEYWISNRRNSAAVSAAAAVAASYRSSYTPISRNSYPLSPLPSPESSSIPTDKARQLYSSPPSLPYMSYNKWYPGSNVASSSNSVVNKSNTASVSTVSNTLSRSSSVSTLATPPSTNVDPYASYFQQQQQQQTLSGCHYDTGMYQRQNVPASHYVASYGATGCSCPDCSFDTMPKMPTWSYNYAAAY